MSWSYSGDPSASDRDQLRFLIQDTDFDNQLMSDEELDYILTDTASSSPYYHAAYACDILVAKYAKMMDKSIDGTSVNYTGLVDRFTALGDKYRSILSTGHTGRKVGAPVLMGGGTKYLGPDDTPLGYDDDQAVPTM